MTDITVEVLGGNVVEVYSKRPEMRVTIIDWDNIKSGDYRGMTEVQDCVSFNQMSPETQQVFKKYHQKN
ncbi:MAG: hypothetical protein WC701_14640 [Kiritimatiellales bacterium]|jgi:hypothetical protein